MNSTNIIKNARSTLFLLAALLLTTASSYALDLAAVQSQWTPPGTATPITMWGFIQDPGSCPAGTVVWAPGPEQIETAGGTLTVSLRNCLSEPVSLVIPGQPTTLDPQVFQDAQGRTRVKSFTHEAGANGGLATYTWSNLKPGTYLYQSGSSPAKHIQMGLFGALKVGSYAEAVNEITLLLSEIDPALHASLSSATPLTYKPKYFLINGQTASAGAPPPVIETGGTTQTLLIRFLNAGLMSHTPAVQGPYMKIVAEDGNPYPFAKEQYSVLLAAGKTMDALWTPEKNGTFAVYDRSLSLSNNGAVGGGMLAHLNADVAPFSWILFIPAITGMGVPAIP